MGDSETEGKKTPMSKEASARITRAQDDPGNTPKGSFASRAQSAADKNENAAKEDGTK